MSGTVTKVSGPLVAASGLAGAAVGDIVHVGPQRLVGEILSISSGAASIQVYEETAGLGPGADVEAAGGPLCAELGPGLLGNMCDGLQRPLAELREIVGHTAARGVQIPALPRAKRWTFEALAKAGDAVVPGDVLGTVRETAAFTHKILVPPGVSGRVASIESGSYGVEDVVCVIRQADGTDKKLTMTQRWPVRTARQYEKRHLPSEPLRSGWRVLDTLFPVAKGGTAAVSGPFGSGKTVLLRALTRWTDPDVVVLIGCGERGNEMADALEELAGLPDPRSGGTLLDRTVLIACTSDMPIAAREAAICTGLTIAEYFRDMGYDAAVIADSTTRWAEALREVSGRLGEQPGEDGWPSSLASRLAGFYGRAGVVDCLGSDERRGSLTAVGVVSPPGGDARDPVSQTTMRLVGAFWNLDPALAWARRFPALDLPRSFSLYTDALKPWYDANFGEDFTKNRERALALLEAEAALLETVGLSGPDALPPEDRLTLETAGTLRGDFLQQDALRAADGGSSRCLLNLLLEWDALCRAALLKGADPAALAAINARGRIGGLRDTPEDEYEEACGRLLRELRAEISERCTGGEEP